MAEQQPAEAEQPAPATKLGRNGKPKGKPGAPKGKTQARNEAFQERVELCARMLVKLLYRSEIQRAIVQKYGEMSWRQVNTYISHARKLLKKQCKIEPDAAKELSINTLLDVIRSGKPGEKVQAVKVWNEIHGLNAPTKVDVQGDVNMNMKFVPLTVDPKLITGDQPIEIESTVVKP